MLLRLGTRLRAAGRHLLVGWHAWRDPALAWPGRLMLALMALYLLSPFDLVPDWLPVLGWLDNLALVSLVLPMLLRLLPAEVLRQAQRRAGLDPQR